MHDNGSLEERHLTEGLPMSHQSPSTLYTPEAGPSSLPAAGSHSPGSERVSTLGRFTSHGGLTSPLTAGSSRSISNASDSGETFSGRSNPGPRRRHAKGEMLHEHQLIISSSHVAPRR